MPGFRRNKLGLCLALAASHFYPGGAFSQSILLHLRNGDRLSGNLLAEEGGTVVVTNAILGRVVLPLAQIQRREWITNQATSAQTPVPPTPILSPPAQRRLDELQAVYLTGQLSAEEYHRQRAKLLAESAAAPSANNQPAAQGLKPAGSSGAAPARAAAAAPKPPSAPVKPAGPKRWTGEVLMGTDLAFSEKNRQLYTGRLKLNYTRTPLRNNLDYLFTYGRTDGELSANRMDGLLKTDYDLNERVYLYFLGAAGYDEIRRIDWRAELGPGSGYHVLKLTNFVLRLEGGVHYQVQNFQGDRQQEIFLYRLAQDLKWNLGTQFTFDGKMEYLPKWDDFAVYKFRLEANLRYWLRSNLSLNLTVIDLFDTVTAQGVGQNDLQLRSSIGLKF